MINDALAAKENQINALSTQHRGNLSQIRGSRNTTNQTGKENWSDVFGDDNNIHQYGTSNKCRIAGEGNSTVQIEMEDMDAAKFAQLFLTDGLRSGSVGS